MWVHREGLRGTAHLVTVTVIVVLVITAGCNGDATESDDQFSQGTSLPLPPAPTVTHHTRQAACADPNYQVALAVTTDIAEEVPLLEDVAACASDRFPGLWLHNMGEAVWRPTTPLGGEDVYGTEPGTVARTFADAMGHESALLVPGQSIIVEADPWSVEWIYDAPLSTAWGFVDLAWDVFQDEAPDQVADLLNPTTLRGKAVTACAKLVWNTASSSYKMISDGEMEPSDAVTNALGTASAGSACYDYWKAADEAASTRTPIIADDLRALRTLRTQALESIDNAVALTFRTNRAVGLLFQLLR